LLNINLGPKTSVILDATYVDDVVRIGKGGISGSRFVFQRCKEEKSDESIKLIQEAKEFQALLERRPMRRSKMVSILASVLGLGFYNLKKGRTVIGAAMLLFSGLGGVILKFSTGGVEMEDHQRGDDPALENQALAT